ncbi:MAG: class I SAM-dependent methyltransferase [Chthoniobacteraceae bacterium]
MAFSFKYFLRGPSVTEERDWERENIRQKTDRYLATNPMDRFETDDSYRTKVLTVDKHLQGVDGLVLDLGGNTAGEATILQQRGFDLVVADINEYALDVSRQRIEKFGLRSPQFVALDAHHLPFRDGVFAAVTVLEALHHFSDYHQALTEIHRVLAPGGRLFSIEPNALNPLRRASEVRDRLRGTIEKSFTPNQLIELCRRAGFARTEIEPFANHRSNWKLQELPPWRRPIAQLHGTLCANFPTVFAALAIEARKAGDAGPVRKAPLAEILQSPLSGKPLRFDAGQWIDDDRKVAFSEQSGVPVLIPGEESPLKET